MGWLGAPQAHIMIVSWTHTARLRSRAFSPGVGTARPGASNVLAGALCRRAPRKVPRLATSFIQDTMCRWSRVGALFPYRMAEEPSWKAGYRRFGALAQWHGDRLDYQ